MTGVLRGFWRNVSAMGLLYVAGNALGLGVGVVLARMLGPAQYGIYALAMTTATLVGLVTEFGLPTLAMRETGLARASGEWGLLRGLLGWADRTIVALSLGLALAGWGAVQLLPAARGSAFGHALLWGVLLIPVVALGKLRALVLLALDRTYASQLPVLVVRPLLFVAGCLALGWAGWRFDAARAMAVQVAASTAATLISVAALRRWRPPALALAHPVRAVAAWLHTCVPMGLTESLRLLQGQLALLLVGALAGAAAAGVYRVADAVAQVTMLVASITATAATPMFARLHGQGARDDLERVALIGAWAMLLGCLALGAPVVLFGQMVLPRLFGAGFAGSFAVFVVLWLGGAGAAGFGLALSLANMTGHHGVTTRMFALIAVINLALGLVLIPRLGALGGALATVLSLGIGTALCAWLVWRRTGINATVFNPRAAVIVRDALAGRHRARAVQP